MALFKSKEEKANERFEKGANLIASKNFDVARKNLMKSIDNGNASPDVHILVAMIDLRNRYEDIRALDAAIEVFSRYENVDVSYGVYDVNSSRILKECKLRVEALKALNAESAAKINGTLTEDIGKELIRCGNEYMSQIGDENLLMEEVFSEVNLTARNYALSLNAQGYEALAQAFKWNNPKRAADYAQQAANYRRDLNQESMAAADEKFVAGASKTIHCWFCGKEVSGEDIHFVPMPSFITKPIQDIIDKSDMPIKSSGPKEVYVCRACYSAIDERDKIYHEMAKRYTDDEVSRVRNELLRRVDDVNRRIDEIVIYMNRR